MWGQNSPALPLKGPEFNSALNNYAIRLPGCSEQRPPQRAALNGPDATKERTHVLNHQYRFACPRVLAASICRRCRIGDCARSHCDSRIVELGKCSGASSLHRTS